MGGRVETRKYLYWSGQQIAAVARDHEVEIPGAPPVRADEASTRRARRLVLECEPRRWDRNDTALKIEMAVGRRAVWDFVSPPPTRFAKGRGTIVLSELAYELDNPAMGMAFTSTTASNGCRVAVCLFCGLANFSEVLTDVTPHVKGWSAPSSRVVSEFVRSRCAIVDPCWGDIPALVAEILRISVRQGEEEFEPHTLTRPWHRGFTYGHISDLGEWFAEIYCDVRASDLLRRVAAGLPVGACAGPPIDEILQWYDRVVVGAPLWIRTPSLRAVTLYDEIPAQELDLDVGCYDEAGR
jgi:hypothetical protein